MYTHSLRTSNNKTKLDLQILRLSKHALGQIPVQLFRVLLTFPSGALHTSTQKPYDLCPLAKQSYRECCQHLPDAFVVIRLQRIPFSFVVLQRIVAALIPAFDVPPAPIACPW